MKPIEKPIEIVLSKEELLIETDRMIKVVENILVEQKQELSILEGERIKIEMDGKL